MNLDINDANRKINEWLHTKFGYEATELQYTKIKPVIMCEEFIEGEKGELPRDYKIYCFYGEPKLALVCSDRKEGTKLNYYDFEWNELPIGKEQLRLNKKIEKPKGLEKMIEISKKLSKDIPYVRIDFYENKGRVLLGEMTFTPAACCAQYYSKEGDKYLSELLKLNN